VASTSQRQAERDGRDDTAVVIIDPQNDVLSETGVSWSLVADSIRENGTPKLGDGYKAALINFGYFASAVLSTQKAVEAMTTSRR